MADSRTLRVALVVPESTGGIGRHVRTLVDGLRAAGDEVTVVAPAATLQRLDLDPAVDGVALAVGAPGAGLRRLRRAIGDCDVVHAHGVRAGAQAALARPGRLVVTWHNAPIGGAARRAVHAALEQVSARGSDLVLVASPDLLPRAARAGARRAAFSPVVAPPLGGAAAGRPDAAQPVVVAIARLHPQKRLDLLLEATAGWAGRPDRPRLLVAGDGPLRGGLEEHARRVASPVEWLGEQADVADLLAQATVVVLPSDWEARPLVAQEALRAGVPLVATAVGGVPGLVEDAALLVAADDAAALRAGLERVLGDTDLRHRLAAAGPRVAATWPTVADMVNDIRSRYLDLIGR